MEGVVVMVVWMGIPLLVALVEGVGEFLDTWLARRRSRIQGTRRAP